MTLSYWTVIAIMVGVHIPWMAWFVVDSILFTRKAKINNSNTIMHVIETDTIWED